MYFYINYHFPIPFNLLQKFNTIVLNNKLDKNLKFKRLNNLFYSEIQSSKKYIARTKINLNLNTVPLRANMRHFGKYTIYVDYYEIGIVTLRAKTEIFDINTIHDEIRQIREELKKLIKKLEPKLKEELKKIIEDEYKSDEMKDILDMNRKAISEFHFSKHNIFVLIFDENINKESYISLCQRLGNGNIRTKLHYKTYRISSKNCAIAYVGDPPKSKKGRRLLREKILFGISMSHGLKHMYNELEYYFQFLSSIEGWYSLIHFNNPFALAGKYLIPGIIGNSLTKTWFIETDASLKLRIHFRNMLINMVQELKINIINLLKLSTAIRKLPYHDTKLLTLSPINIDRLIGANNNVETIIELLYNEYNNCINQESEYKLTLNQILKKLNKPSNENNYSWLRNIIYSLMKYNIIEIDEYTHKGNKRKYPVYFLSKHVIDLRVQIISYIDEKIPNNSFVSVSRP